MTLIQTLYGMRLRRISYLYLSPKPPYGLLTLVSK